MKEDERMELKFEPLAEHHAAAVMEIFNYYIENSFAAYPETPLPLPFFNKLLEMNQGYPAYAIVDGLNDSVIGFCMMRPYNPLPTFRETAELTYFIDQQFVGKGIGKTVLDKLEEDAKDHGIRNLLANISSKNEQSIAFHRRQGFSECGRLAGIGKKKGEVFDVVWMEKRLELQ